MNDIGIIIEDKPIKQTVGKYDKINNVNDTKLLLR